MAGRIRDVDIAAVRERANLEDVVREFVTLKSAGSGAFKGLCPFHDERSASFHVTPSRGAWYCFGCGEGGDVFSFLQKVEHIGFVEAVERLADKTGIILQYTDGEAPTPESRGQRTRLIAAHHDAETFYRAQLGTPESATGVTFLKERGFDRAAADQFGVGYAPKGWDTLTKHLLALGHTAADLVTGGLTTEGPRGVYDKFRGRLMWPIRSASGETIGFGARKLYDDDTGPKYLNTSETPLYKKSQVLYGIDLARKNIATTREAIVVEGYTDVMACHLAGFPTAVAACGTAFGTEHVGILRRLLMDDDVMAGAVTFTFDGDAAGQKAALRAFSEDQRFVARTFVAVEPHGMDPCEVRIASGNAGVQALLASRVPLFEFAIKSMLAKHDLNSPEGRVAALHQAAPVVARIKDPALRPEYVRLLAGWLGLDVSAVRTAVIRSTGDTRPVPAAAAAVTPPEWAFERETLKCVLQHAGMSAEWYGQMEPSTYTNPDHQTIHAAVVAADPASGLTSIAWVEAVLHGLPDDDPARALVRELAVAPLISDSPTYIISVIARTLELDASRRIDELKSQAQRATPAEQQDLLSDLMALETYRRELLTTVHAAS
jgi:DNA primase